LLQRSQYPRLYRIYNIAGSVSVLLTFSSQLPQNWSREWRQKSETKVIAAHHSVALFRRLGAEGNHVWVRSPQKLQDRYHGMSSPRDSIRALSCLATRFKRVRPIERTLTALKENSICGSKYKIWKQADSSTLTKYKKVKNLGSWKRTVSGNSIIP